MHRTGIRQGDIIHLGHRQLLVLKANGHTATVADAQGDEGVIDLPDTVRIVGNVNDTQFVGKFATA
ncbi:MAG: hypothetical protein ABR616_15840 [Dermatophilaceae bacterium]